MWELDHKEGWESNNWCFQIVVLEKTLESPLKSKNIKPINTEGNQPWIFTGRADAEAPILWLVDSKSWLIRKDPDIGKDWRQMGKETTEDENGWTASPMRWTWVWATLRVGDGQQSYSMIQYTKSSLTIFREKKFKGE